MKLLKTVVIFCTLILFSAAYGQPINNPVSGGAVPQTHQPSTITVEWTLLNETASTGNSSLPSSLPYYIASPNGRDLDVIPVWDRIAKILAEDGKKRSATIPQQVRVVVLDSGVWPHKDLHCLDQGSPFNKSYLRTPLGGGFDPFSDTVPHGTNLAGVICAEQNQFMVGLLPEEVVAISAVRLIDGSWNGWSGYSTQGNVCNECIVPAINQMVETKKAGFDSDIVVVNMSWGMFSELPGLKEAIASARKAGFIFVAAAGNNSASQVHYPCSYPEVVCVSALDQNEELAGFANFDKTKVDIVSYGETIKSLFPFDQYATLRGTSESAPMVSAALAYLVWEARRQGVERRLSVDDIVGTLYEGAKTVIVDGRRGFNPEPPTSSDLVKVRKLDFEGARVALQKKIDALRTGSYFGPGNGPGVTVPPAAPVPPGRTIIGR